jgi:hypothetical protein
MNATVVPKIISGKGKVREVPTRRERFFVVLDEVT